MQNRYLLKREHIIVVLVLRAHTIIISNACGSRGSRQVHGIVPWNAGWISDAAIPRSNSIRLRKAANRNTVSILWKHCCQRLMVCTVFSKCLLETRWHIRIVLRQERIANHVGKWPQRKSRLGIRVCRKMLGKSRALCLCCLWSWSKASCFQSLLVYQKNKYLMNEFIIHKTTMRRKKGWNVKGNLSKIHTTIRVCKILPSHITS